MRKILKEQKGITLIALVITIIILVILAGVAISMLTGENGIFTKVQYAAQEQERANIQDLTIAGYYYELIAATQDFRYLNMEKTSQGIYTNLTNNGYKLKAADGSEIVAPENLLTTENGVETISLNVKGSHGEYTGQVTNTGLTEDIKIVGVSNNEPITPEPEPPLGEETVTNPYESDAWEFAYSSKDGVWSDKIIDVANLDETAVDIVAKFYKTEKIMPEQSFMGVAEIKQGYEYNLVIEGSGEMAPIYTEATNIPAAWGIEIFDFIQRFKSGEFAGGTPIDIVEVFRTTEVIICDGITNIGEYAFPYSIFLSKVTMSNTVTKIDSKAFINCSNLIDVTLSNQLTILEDNVFEYCRNLKNITIPNSVTSIGEYAFASCSNLTDVTLSNQLTKIEGRLFENCTSLKNITIPNSVTSIDKNAFFMCKNIERLTIPGSVTIIGESAFQHCEGLKNLVISHGVKRIGSLAFSNCISLKELTIPGSIEHMDYAVFPSNTSLEKVTLLEGVTSIYGQAFWDCTSLKSIIIPKSVISVDIKAFENCSVLANIYYAGTEEDWNKITIKTEDNEKFIAATKLYNYVYPTQEN